MAIAEKAPPITRIRIGVASSPPLGADAGGAVDDDVPVAVDLGDETRWNDRRRVVLLDDRGALDPVAGAQQLAVEERCQTALCAAADVEDDLALDGLRGGGVAVALRQLGPVELLDPSDADGPDVDDLDLGVEAVPVLPLVRRVESLLQLLDPGVVDRARRDVEPDLVPLARVAAVGEPPDEPPLLGYPVGVELRDGLGAELVEARGQPLAVERLQRVPFGRDVLVLEVGGEQARRRGDARVRRDDHARDLELERDVAGEQRPGAAGGDERELARVVAAADAVQLDRLRHPELLDLERAERGLVGREAHLRRDRLHRGTRQLRVELHLAAEQAAVGPQPAEQQLGVGRGRALRRRGRSRRARVGARGLRADAKDAARVDVGDRAAARADRVDVDHRHHRLVVADLRVEQVAHPQLAARSDADVGRRAADVERDDVVVARHLPAQIPPIRPATGPDISRFTGRCVADVDRRHAARGLHQLHLVREARGPQRLVEAFDVARDLRADVRVQADGREALELAVERQHLVRDRQVGVRELLEHDLLDPPLVRRVEVRVEQADGDRLDAARR